VFKTEKDLHPLRHQNLGGSEGLDRPDRRGGHISTLKTGETVDVLLNPSEWHESMHGETEKIRSFEIVKKNGRYYVHVLCEYRVPPSPLKGVAGVVLGLRRPLSAVLVDMGFHFSTLHNEKEERLKPLNNRVSHLRRLEKGDLLKTLRHKLASCHNSIICLLMNY
jgi:transposase